MGRIAVAGLLVLLSLLGVGCALDPGVKVQGHRLEENTEKGEGQWRREAAEQGVGASLHADNMIRYEFSENQGLPATDFVDIRVGFITRKKDAILLQIRDETDTRFISLEINSIRGVKFHVDVGVRWEINTGLGGIDVTDGQPHVVTLRRDNSGRIVELMVDGAERIINWMSDLISDRILDNPKYMYIGNNGTEKSFEGCIYGVHIDDIYPLKLASKDPMPPYVQPIGDLRMCSPENDM